MNLTDKQRKEAVAQLMEQIAEIQKTEPTIKSKYGRMVLHNEKTRLERIIREYQRHTEQ